MKKDPYEGINFIKTKAEIKNKEGKVIFSEEVEFPDYFSENSINIVSNKYLHNSAKKKETSLKQMIDRVSETIAEWGKKDGYFNTDEEEEYEDFLYNLKYYQIHQYFAFNSPVYFNVGIQEKAQCNACQPGWALINTPKGLISIKEIVKKNKIDLEVFDDKGKTNIISVKENGKKEIIRLTTKDGFYIDITKDHLVFMSKERKRIPKAIQANKIKLGYYLYVFYNQEEYSTQKTNTYEVSEVALAGWLQTDGFVGKNNYSTSKSWVIEFITINEDERNYLCSHMKKIFPDVKFNVIPKKTQDNKVDYISYRAYGLKFEKFINKYKLFLRREYKKVPDQLFSASIEVIISYLRSIFQADGYVLIGPGRYIGIQSISCEFIKGIQLLLARLNIYSKIMIKKDKRKNRKNGYVLLIGFKNNKEKFKNLINFIGEDKKDKLDRSIKESKKNIPFTKCSKIINIENMGCHDVYDIQTESEKYLTNSVLVHNCFILKIEDNMDSITEIGKIEAKIFKNGSGSGINYSPVRASCEKVRGQNFSSGPVSFLKIHDTGAGIVKSGNTHRRAAKLACLNVDHPDIEKFIKCKEIEEEKLRILSKNGIKPYPGYEMSDHVFFQNTNLSIGIMDDFMNSVKNNISWNLVSRLKTDTTPEGFPFPEITKNIQARDLFNKIVEGAWKVGCPGMLFLDTINEWNTCKNSGKINSTNPCGELAWLDNSACSLASINLLKFFHKKGNEFIFDFNNFSKVINTIITSLDIMIDKGSYPTKEIAKNSKEYRPLGLGYSNLHATLMYLGIPYDSKEGRDMAAAITSLMTATAYRTSEAMSIKKESFKHFEKNRDSIVNILLKHRNKNLDLFEKYCLEEDEFFTGKQELIHKILDAARINWNVIEGEYECNGLRNAQVTLLAPTGTISFLMGCDTFGIQPEFSLIKYKNLVSTEQGGISLHNSVIPEALRNLGYMEDSISNIMNKLDDLGHTKLASIHLPIFDTEMKNGNRRLDHMALVKMMAAVQPFLSGAISSTVNISNDATTKDIEDIFMKAWEWGLKGITVYRYGTKYNQPLVVKEKEPDVVKWITENGKKNDAKAEWEGLKGDGVPPPKTGELKYVNPSSLNSKCIDVCEEGVTKKEKRQKEKLPITRKGINHKFEISGCKGYIKTGEYEDGRLGEVFLTVSKQGSTLSGLLDSVAIQTSLSLQFGVPLEDIVRKMMNMRFEPAGITRNKDIRFAKSLVDYIFRFLGMYYLPMEEQIELGLRKKETKSSQYPQKRALDTVKKAIGLFIDERRALVDLPSINKNIVESDSPMCNECGAIMLRTGSCYTCISCGTSSGSCG